MSSQANFVVVDRSGWNLYFARTAARYLGPLLVLGPAAATEAVTSMTPVENRHRDWLDDAFADGGAVIDHTSRELILYSEELLDILDKRVLLELVRLRWNRWRVEWAYDGLGDLTAAVGVDRSVVRSPDPDARARPTELATPDLPCHLVTVRYEDGRVLAYPLHSDYLTGWHGPALLDYLPPEGTDRLTLTEAPASGLHVDVPERTVGYWLGTTGAGLGPVMPGLWPGWRVLFWQDRFERQLLAAGGVVSVPTGDPVAALNRVLDEIADEDNTFRPDDVQWKAVRSAAAELHRRFLSEQPGAGTPAWQRHGRPVPEIADFLTDRLDEQEAAVHAAARLQVYEQRARRFPPDLPGAPPSMPRLSYPIGERLEPVHEEPHLEHAPGSGTHTWRAGLFTLSFRSIPPASPGDSEQAHDEAQAIRHAGYHSPARTAAELDAKRRIIARYHRARNELARTTTPAACERHHQLLLTLRELASAHQHHPDHDPEWTLD